jgi:hypothetical protein
LQSHNKVICGQKIKNLSSNFLTTIPNSPTTDRGPSVAMLCSLRLTFKKERFAWLAYSYIDCTNLRWY